MEFERKPPSNSKIFCCVYKCNAKASRSRNLSFHVFPKPGIRKVIVENKFGNHEKVDLYQAWMQKLKMGKTPSKYMKVCSLHFTSNDYNQNAGVRKILKKTAVPSVNLPQGSVKIKQPHIRKPKRFNIETKSMEQEMVSHSELSDEVENYDIGGEDYTQEERLVAETLLSLCEKKYEDIGIQVNTNVTCTVAQLITTDKQLNSMTGLHSFQLLNSLEHLVKTEHKDQRTHRISCRDRIILTFLKLKNDISYVVLSILFGGISSQTCKAIFFEIIPLLSKVLSPAVYFPCKEEIASNLPKCFDLFSNVRIVLDCTEIFVQTPKCLCCRIKTYSHYKSKQTIKFMVGVSPGGLITFISKAYGGRASDKAIFEQSQLFEKLIPYKDAIMVDKGFLIDTICESYGIKLIRPSFLKKKKQLSQVEANVNACIASARVHIERMNQRIKIFKILNNTFSWSLIGLVDHIFLIICAICNLSRPILSQERF